MLADSALYLGPAAAAGAAVVSFAAYRYKVASPDQYLVRTGLGIKDIAISKQGFQWPFQKYKFISVHPDNYRFNLRAMSSEKIPFILPGVFTIGPKNDTTSLVDYVRVLEGIGDNAEKSQDKLRDILLGILEGETRTLSSQMTMEEIFNGRKVFKETVMGNIQKELDQIGLWIYNANIEELEDGPGSKYFNNMSQKKASETESQAIVAVAEAKKIGDIGKKEREAITRQQTAELEASAKLRENERQQDVEKSTANLEVVRAEAYRLKTIANVEAQKAAEARSTDLQREVEQKRVAMEIEKLRAIDMVKAQVQAEAKVKEAEGAAQAIRLEADAKLYAKQAEARGVQSLLEAQAQGLERVVTAFGGDADAFTRYMMMDKDMLVKLAHENASALRGMNPQIVQWNTSAGGKDESPLVDVFKMIPPLVTTIHKQTGIKPPNWLMDIETPKV